MGTTIPVMITTARYPCVLGAAVWVTRAGIPEMALPKCKTRIQTVIMLAG
jgi:hypothetical protein